jgi:diguanylate cyclase (GGDEF)-like protein/PAS domain S-box-containing protein
MKALRSEPLAQRPSKVAYATLCIALLAGAMQLSGLTMRLDNLAADLYLSLKSRSPDPSIVIVEIDRNSLERIGRWPWSRAAHATLVDLASRAGAAAIGFDVAFVDRDATGSEGDAAFAASLSRNNRVVLPVFIERDETGARFESRPLPHLATARLGRVDVPIDRDGLVRRMIDGDQHAALTSTAFADAVWQASRDSLPPGGDGAQQRMRYGERLIPFSSFVGQFHRLSFADVIADPRMAEFLRGRTVLVGVTAPGLAPGFLVPGKGGPRIISGIELQAHALNAIAQGSLVRPAGWILDTAAALLVAIVITSLVAFAPSPRLANSFVAAALAVCILGPALLLMENVWLSPVLPVVILAIGHVGWWWLHTRAMGRSARQFRSHLTAAMQSTDDAFVMINAEGTVTEMNPAASALFGCRPDEARGTTFNRLFRFNEKSAAANLVTASVTQCMQTRRLIRPAEKMVLERSDAKLSFRLSVTPIDATQTGADGPCVLVTLNDVTRIEHLAESISYLERHHPLTGLPNRSAFLSDLAKAIATARRTNGELAVVAFELVGFARIEHTLGTAIGDRVVRKAARRLAKQAIPGDSLGHWSRVEFAVVMPCATGRESTIERVNGALSALTVPFAIDERELQISARAGVAWFPSEGDDADTLARKASVALRGTRRGAGAPVGLYSEQNDWWGQGNLELQIELGHAIERNELRLHYQPQIDVVGGHVVGVEALLRWQHPRLGLLGPDRIIPVAEASDLIIAVGEWAANTAAGQLAAWRKGQTSLLTMSINVSNRQLLRSDVAALAKRIMATHGLGRGELIFELTESMLMHDPDQCEKTMAALRRAGITVSIDDFGTGYSSLAHLQKLTVDQIKIDQSFIQLLPGNSGSTAIVQAVLAMARALGIPTVAEGVENSAQVDWLRDHRCEKVQGYFYGRPVPADEIPDLIDSIQTRLLGA